MNRKKIESRLRSVAVKYIDEHGNPALTNEIVKKMTSDMVAANFDIIVDHNENFKEFVEIRKIIEAYAIIRFDDEVVFCRPKTEVEKMIIKLQKLHNNFPEIPTTVRIVKNDVCDEPLYFQPTEKYDKNRNVNEIGKDYASHFTDDYSFHGPVELMRQLDSPEQSLFFKFASAYGIPMNQLAVRFDQFAEAPENSNIPKGYKPFLAMLIQLMSLPDTDNEKLSQFLIYGPFLSGFVSMIYTNYPDGKPKLLPSNPPVEISESSSSSLKRSSDGENSNPKRTKELEHDPEVPKLTSSKRGMILGKTKVYFDNIKSKEIKEIPNKLVTLYAIWAKALHHWSNLKEEKEITDEYLKAERECMLEAQPSEEASQILTHMFTLKCKSGGLHLRAKIAYGSRYLGVKEKKTGTSSYDFTKFFWNQELATFVYPLGRDVYGLFFQILALKQPCFQEIGALLGYKKRSSNTPKDADRKQLYDMLVGKPDLEKAQKLSAALFEKIWGTQQ